MCVRVSCAVKEGLYSMLDYSGHCVWICVYIVCMYRYQHINSCSGIQLHLADLEV